MLEKGTNSEMGTHDDASVDQRSMENVLVSTDNPCPHVARTWSACTWLLQVRGPCLDLSGEHRREQPLMNS